MLASVSDRSHVAAVRRAAADAAAGSQLDKSVVGRLELIITEMATNILKHAVQGQIAISTYQDAQGTGIELIAFDKGAGIADTQRALTDGVSTAGSPGSGLGAIRRQADHFAIYSRPGLGTAVLARCGKASNGESTIVGAVNDPYPGEMKSGDAWSFASTANAPTLFLVDGSGHGNVAAVAADTAVKTFQAHVALQPVLLADRIHRALAPTRGGAIALARINQAERSVQYVGVGNITGALLDGASISRMVSNNGTAGHLTPRIREFTYGYQTNPTIVLHSDGLSAKWDMKDHPGLSACHPSLIAAVLFRDHRRGRDDATVVVARMAT